MILDILPLHTQHILRILQSEINRRYYIDPVYPIVDPVYPIVDPIYPIVDPDTFGLSCFVVVLLYESRVVDPLFYESRDVHLLTKEVLKWMTIDSR